jgi:hypothetical protein
VPNPRLRVLALLSSLLLLLAACGSGDDTADDTDDADETSTTTTEDPEGDEDDADRPASTTSSSTTTTVAETTTTVVADGPTGVLAEGTVVTAGGTTSNWALSATATSLCFTADLGHTDPGVADGLGGGVDDCLEPDGGLDRLDSGLSVDVGSVDGEKTIGFLWGRVAPDVISLTIEHEDGTQTPIEILDGPTDVGVFAYVVEIASIPPVQDLDAVSGTQIEGSEPIRGFLRAGPTYPVATPPPSTTAPDYPVS